MKKLFALLVASGMAIAAQATPIASDDFSVAGAITNNGWVAFNGADGSITSDGSVATIGGGAEDIRLSFADQGTGPTFASFVLNVSLMPATGSEYSFGFIDGSTMESRFGLTSVGSGANFALTIYGAGSTILGTSSTLDLDTDYLVAFYFDGVDNHRLWIDSDGTDFASPDLSATGANSGIDGVFIRQAGALDNGASTWTMDDLVVATTFAEVIPEPASVGLMLIGMLGLRYARRRQAA
jgi:hypothetical protein